MHATIIENSVALDKCCEAGKVEIGLGFHLRVGLLRIIR